MPNTINSYQNIPYGALKDRLPQNVNDKLPQEVQNLSTQDVKDTVQKNEVVSAVGNKEMTPRTVALTGSIWVALAALCDKINLKFRGDYDKSWLGKIGKFGDNISNAITKPGSVGEKIVTNVSKSKNWFFDKLPFLKTPTKPLNSMAISQSNGILGYMSSDASGLLKTFIEEAPDNYKLICPKAKNAKSVLDLIEKVSSDPKKYNKALDYLITNLKKMDDKNIIEVKWLIKPKKWFGIKIPGIPNISKFSRKVTGKELGNKWAAAAGDILTNNKSAQTGLGRSLVKNTAKIMEGVTNGYAGGKILIVIQAMIFAQAIDKAIKAPKGEKFQTFMTEMSTDLGMFMAMPLYVKGNHVLGSMKYIGMGKDVAEQTRNVKAYREYIEQINKKIADGIKAKDPFLYTRRQYLDDVKKAKDMLKGNSKWYQKPFKAIGKLFGRGLEEVKPYTVDLIGKTGGAFTAKLKNVWHSISKGKLGGALRFAFGMFVIGALVGKGINKIVTTIFGKTTAQKEEEAKEKAEKLAKKEAKKAKNNQNTQNNSLNMTEEELMEKLNQHPELIEKLQTDKAFVKQITENPQLLIEMLNAPSAANAGNQTSGSNQIAQFTQEELSKMSPALRKRITEQGTQEAQATQNPTGTSQMQTTPSNTDLSNNGVQNPIKEPVRTYIPSSAPAKLTGTLSQEEKDNVQRALERANSAEQEALKYLGNV